MSNNKMYTKPGLSGETLLYDGDGKLVGRGFSDSHGTTRFTGADGEYIGRSDPGLFGCTKLFDADGEYLASGVDGIAQRKTDMRTFLRNTPEKGQEAHTFDEGFCRDDDTDYDECVDEDNDCDEDEDCDEDMSHFCVPIMRRKTTAAPKAKAVVDANSNFEIVGETLVKYRGNAQIIALPKGIRRIGPRAFVEKDNLEAVVFPEGLLEISSDAFIECPNLVSVVLPESLIHLRSDCLRESNIRSIRIPSNVVTIESGALPMGSLSRIIVSPQNPLYKTVQTSPGLFSKDGKTLYNIPGDYEDIYDDEEVIPEGVEVFAAGLFSVCPSELHRVIFPQSLRKIDCNVFMNWNGEYDTVCLPPNVEEIDAMAFGFLRIRNLYIPRKANVSPDVFPKSYAKKYPTVIHRYDKQEPWMKFELITPWCRHILRPGNLCPIY